MKLVLASGNTKKLNELKQITDSLGWEVLPQSEFDVPEAAETGLTFVENAIIKARNACHYTGLPALADDSGLEVDYLLGEPGIYSARFAGEHGNDSANNELLVKRLKGVPAHLRGGRYQALLVLMQHENDPTPLICQGSWEGMLLDTPRGNNGFGYDAYFYIPALGMTAAELDATTKNRVSHRGRALQQLAASIKA